MFGISGKEVDRAKALAFVDWFLQNEERIRHSVENRAADRQTMLTVLDEVEAELAKVYRDGYKGTIEFDYGGQDAEWELHLYHKNKKFLIAATSMIAEELNARQNAVWKAMSLR